MWVKPITWTPGLPPGETSLVRRCQIRPVKSHLSNTHWQRDHALFFVLCWTWKQKTSRITAAFSAHGATGFHITLAAGQWTDSERNSVFNGDVTVLSNDSVLSWTTEQLVHILSHAEKWKLQFPSAHACQSPILLDAICGFSGNSLQTAQTTLHARMWDSQSQAE